MSSNNRKEKTAIYTGTKAPLGEDLADEQRRRRIRRPKRREVAAVVGIVSILLAAWIGRSAVRGPAFYRHLLASPSDSAYQDGRQIEVALANLHGDIQHSGDWQIVLREKNINGWLSAHLPSKFPHALPDNIANPRMQITATVCRLAFQTKLLGFEIIIAADAEFFLTQEENVVGMRIKGAKAGMIPLPIAGWTESFSESALKSGFKVRWTQEGGDPLALITIPDEIPDYDELRLVLKAVAQRNGELVLSGTTVER